MWQREETGKFREKNIIQLTSQYMWMIAKVILSYYTLGPAYYMVLDSLYNIASDGAAGAMLIFLTAFQPIFHYAWATFHVLALIFIIAGYTRKLRERYYATQEVTYLGY